MPGQQANKHDDLAVRDHCAHTPTMLLSIAADERAALQFDDLASALDAGLPLASLGGDPAAGDRAVHAALRTRGVTLTPTEDAVLLHAWRAGKTGSALRGRAMQRRRRAEFVRQVWAGLRYPMLLALLLLMASITTMTVLGPTFLIVVVTAYAALGVSAWLLGRAARTGDARLAKIPFVGRIIMNLGELPYLETLHALYGAGVQLNQAHAAAVGTVRVGAVRQRLQIADRVLQSGRPLREALHEAIALHPESRQLLATGEQAGQLEDALHRALDRRRDVAARELAGTARRVGQIAYFVALVACVLLIAQFYTSYFARIRGR